MRAPLSWLREYADLPESTTGHEVAERLTYAGLKVEQVTSPAAEVSGPLVVGRVLEVAEETHRNGKTIRWCQVDVGEGEPRGIVCGAFNFAAGDAVAVALPGTVLPGGFAISARKTYGHVSDGMIASARELAIGEDHAGILVLDPTSHPGSDALDALGMRDEVLDVAVTPDRGYALSLRGLAREVATAFGVTFTDPAALDAEPADGTGWPVQVQDPDGCDRFVARTVTGLDPAAPSPEWLTRRLHLAGVRPISLAVDVTNYVMLEMGQPIHGYDRGRLTGAITVRRARAGERLTTLDDVDRALRPEDLLITDESGPIGLAGVMGGASTEMGTSTSEVVIEAAHFDPVTVAGTARRHKLPSEASRRFERGVDPELPPVAAHRVARLLAELGAARVEPGGTDVRVVRPRERIVVPGDRAERVAGRPLAAEVAARRLEQVGCTVASRNGTLEVTPPSWRPDLTDPADLDEEVLRLEGYDTIPSTLPAAPAGRGLTTAQRLRRRAGRALADAGYVEAPSYPFVGETVWDAFGVEAWDERRRVMRLANPLSEEEPDLRTALLPGLLAALRRNLGRGQDDLALFEVGTVFRPAADIAPVAPRLPVDRRPTDEEIAAVEAALPAQPTHLGVALAGLREPAGWWGPGRAADWADAVDAARTVAAALGVDLHVRQGACAPWHPGRCAALHVEGELVGHAGELHPRTVAALGLPDRTCAAEVNLDALIAAAPALATAPAVSTYPVAKEDVALVVDADVPAADVQAALTAGGGALLESVRLFDVYTGPQVPTGKRSLAYALRLRAADRTLTVDEVSAARDAAVAEASRRTGAVLRGA